MGCCGNYIGISNYVCWRDSFLTLKREKSIMSSHRRCRRLLFSVLLLLCVGSQWCKRHFEVRFEQPELPEWDASVFYLCLTGILFRLNAAWTWFAKIAFHVFFLLSKLSKINLDTIRKNQKTDLGWQCEQRFCDFQQTNKNTSRFKKQLFYRAQAREPFWKCSLSGGDAKHTQASASPVIYWLPVLDDCKMNLTFFIVGVGKKAIWRCCHNSFFSRVYWLCSISPWNRSRLHTEK